MKFLVLFLAILLQQQIPRKRSWGGRRFFERWMTMLEATLAVNRWADGWRFLVAVIIPAVLVSVGFWLLGSVAWGLPAFAGEILLLLALLSQANVGRSLRQYRDCLGTGDVQGAWFCAEQAIALPESALSDEAESMNRQVLQAVMYRWFEYFFLIVFWYVVADVAGVILAWLTLNYVRRQQRQGAVADDIGKTDAEEVVSESEIEPASKPVVQPLSCIAVNCLHWLEWAPARLLGLTYCLAGNMTLALPVWKSLLWKSAIHSQQVLDRIASAALSVGYEGRHWHSAATDASAAAQELEEWHQLHIRSGSVWLVVIAVATIGGWLL
ncbi:regulatory signaling modulator protein AmpE [Oceanobacter mangrovi]|uniref:regulatory signaling modulator protein AmpE n=1 Tax=Oceanobacter mangrovi TaxID=2862510 RepID=UPI001C8E7BBF|nr:regulatory signaling modulator protein AmpE [Oceanobacter mangrovi]